MFKKLTKYILAVCGTIAMTACGDEVEVPGAGLLPDSPGSLTINLKNCTPTRAEEDDPYNETFIQDLYIGLYHRLAEEDKPATVWKKVENVTKVENDTKYEQTKLVWPLTDDIIQTLFDGGNQNATCRVVVIANVEDVPDNASISDIRNMAVGSGFDSNATPASFVMEGEADMEYSVLLNKASANVSLIRAAAKINFSISLPEKVEIDGKDETWTPVPDGIKVLLNNGVKSAIAAPTGLKNDPWKPAAADAYFSSDPNEESSYRKMKASAGETGVEEGFVKYEMESPFYTYPNTWIENHDGSRKTSLTLMVPWKLEGSEGEPAVYYYQVAVTPAGVNLVSRNSCYNVDLKVGMLGSVMPEKPLEVQGTYQIVSWQEEEIAIPIQDSRYLVASSNVLTVNNEEEITIPYYTSHPAEISDISITYKRFNFYSDGNGDVVDIEIPKEVIDRSVMVTNTTRAEVRDSLCAYSIEYSQASKQLMVRIKHPLKIWIPYQSNGTTEVKLTGNTSTGDKKATLKSVNDKIWIYKKPANPEASYSPYEINVTLSHKDLPSVKQEVKITQYPGMYIEAVRNPGGKYNYGYKLENGVYIAENDRDLGYTFINAVHRTIGEYPNQVEYWANNGKEGVNYDSNLGTAQGLITNGNNCNPNMYIINISTLDKDSEYIIGDPRSQYICNNLAGTNALSITKNEESDAGSWCYDAQALFDGDEYRKLRYYYPTRESNTNSSDAMMVAPRFRVASSFGAVGRTTFNKENARRRAATYQEQGCPAGRWRLPTKGEFTYIMQLSGKKIIPYLFSIGVNYLTAQGPYKVDAQGVVSASSISTSAVLRSVYDDWYWNEKTDYVLKPDESGAFSYTLGDLPRAPREVPPASE